MKYKIRRIPGGYSAALYVPMGDRRQIVFTASAYEREIRRDLKRGRSEAQVEGLFGSIGKAAKRLTKSKALRKSVRSATKILMSPEASAALMVVNPALGIGLQSSLQGLNAAEKLMRNAKSAPKGSKKRIAARATLKAAQLVASKEKDDPTEQLMRLLQSPTVNQALALPGGKRGGKDSGKTALSYLMQLMSAA